METVIPIELFIEAAKEFANISDRLCDGWSFVEAEDLYKNYLRKETFINKGNLLVKAEFIVFYNLSYGVPSFSFNIWSSSGALLTLEDIRKMAVTEINQKDFYSVITQQEHPILSRPYYIMHPCHTEALLSIFKDKTKNIIVTFLGVIVPLLPQLNLSLEYGISKKGEKEKQPLNKHTRT